MTLPTILLALIIAMLIGALYHFLRGGGGWRLLMFFGLSILGFAFGQLIGAWQDWRFFMLGSLNIGMGSAGSLLVLALGEWLSKLDSG
jgi:hypothetical protein